MNQTRKVKEKRETTTWKAFKKELDFLKAPQSGLRSPLK
jgi:hypothetical protein